MRRGLESRTEALVLYDERHVYVTFRALDPEPVSGEHLNTLRRCHPPEDMDGGWLASL